MTLELKHYLILLKGDENMQNYVMEIFSDYI